LTAITANYGIFTDCLLQKKGGHFAAPEFLLKCFRFRIRMPLPTMGL
jgi:hypothetical protein